MKNKHAWFCQGCDVRGCCALRGFGRSCGDCDEQGADNAADTERDAHRGERARREGAAA